MAAAMAHHCQPAEAAATQEQQQRQLRHRRQRGSEAEGGASADVDTSDFEGLDDVELIGADNTSKG